MKLMRLEVGGLWSFHPSVPVRLVDFGQVNLLIGPNNSGKSSLLRCFAYVSSRLTSLAQADEQITFGKKDLYQESGLEINPHLRVVFELRGSDLLANTSITRLKLISPQLATLAQRNSPIQLDIGTQPHPEVPHVSTKMLRAIITSPSTEDFNKKPGTRKAIVSAAAHHVEYLQDWRRLDGPTKGNLPSFVVALRDFKGAGSEELEKHQMFEDIQDFFRNLTGLPDAELQPEVNAKELIVKWRKRYLPITQFGAGISHLLMLAYFTAHAQSHVFLIEEPELGLHPGLQKVALRFLHSQANREHLPCQLLMTTHSSAMLDEGLVDHIYHVRHDGDRTTIQEATGTADAYSILNSMDIRPSDILQANTVIWVEGPSDRLFIKSCLKRLHPKLVEGRDFQIVCYGGSLGRHLATEEDERDFINILRLARSVAIVSDSDRSASDMQLSKTATHLQKECLAANGYWWETDGRETENYLSADLLARSYRRLLNAKELPELQFGQFDRLEKALQQWKDYADHGYKHWLCYADAKPKIMREIMKQLSDKDLDHLGLRDRIGGLAAFIRDNGSFATSHSS